MTIQTLLIDNYDSYTYNLYQLVAEVNQQEPIVLYNDQYTWSELSRFAFDNIIISPGPGHPANKRDFGISQQILWETNVPVLGVCLGHQGLGHVYGAVVSHAPEIMHGRLSQIFHKDVSLFQHIPQAFLAVRYHSLAVKEPLPDCLEKIAWTANGVIMGLRHRERSLWGVQFHPESICTEYGRQLLDNFRVLTIAHKSGGKSE